MTDNTQILVYLVDDDNSVLEAISMFLFSADIEVQAFQTAKDLLNRMPREENACLVTDIKMNGINGFMLLQELNEKRIKIPVIFLTAYDTPESRQQAKQAGAAGFLRKPVDGQALLDTIQWAVCSTELRKVNNKNL